MMKKELYIRPEAEVLHMGKGLNLLAEASLLNIGVDEYDQLDGQDYYDIVDGE